jgi:hypothetical protein
VHTGFSFDAVNYGNRLAPADALAFGQGEAVLLPPLDSNGVGTRSVQLDRPLDFLAVTDHGEFLGEVGLCWTEGSAVYDSDTCTTFRSDSANGAFDFGVLLASRNPERFEDVCGADGQGCQDMARTRWREMQDAAEAAYDRTSACAFTSFPAYEYTNTRDVSNLHRNVVFQHEVVPDLPVTHMEAPTPLGLWEGLQDACDAAGDGCEVLVLPHNSNLSNGQLFTPEFGVTASEEEQNRIATLRAEMEPVVEIFQHKGDSECRNGFGQADDPHCEFEKLRPTDDDLCGDDVGAGGMRLWGCSHRLDFVRNVLSEGLVEEERLGVNPYQLGFIGSTDTHNGTPGLVDSWDFPGHVGIVDDTDDKRLSEGTITHDAAINNPGGLSGVWATENSRVAIFDAFRRKEVFATSGPRIPVRFFGGNGLDGGLCSDPDRIETATSEGVPMGGSFSAGSTAPIFLVEATWDAGVAGKPGVPLQQIQIVKVWLDTAGTHQESVYTVAGDGEDGRIKSAIGIGGLLQDGIGDTIRVSLTESPVAEVPVGQKIACGQRQHFGGGQRVFMGQVRFRYLGHRQGVAGHGLLANGESQSERRQYLTDVPEVGGTAAAPSARGRRVQSEAHGLGIGPDRLGHRRIWPHVFVHRIEGEDFQPRPGHLGGPFGHFLDFGHHLIQVVPVSGAQHEVCRREFGHHVRRPAAVGDYAVHPHVGPQVLAQGVDTRKQVDNGVECIDPQFRGRRRVGRPAVVGVPVAHHGQAPTFIQRYIGRNSGAVRRGVGG